MANLIEQTAADAELYDLVSLPSLLIVIDAWAKDTGTPNAKAVVHNIIDFANNQNFALQAVALASYVDRDDGIVALEEPWYTNGRKLFYDSATWEPLRNVWQKTTFQTQDQGFTDEGILSLSKNDCRECFILWDHIQLLYYMNHVNPCVKNIILSGFTWGHCLEYRSLGRRALSDLLYYNMLDRDCNILSHKQIVSVADNSSLHVYSPWIDIGCDWMKVDMDKHAATIQRLKS